MQLSGQSYLNDPVCSPAKDPQFIYPMVEAIPSKVAQCSVPFKIKPFKAKKSDPQVVQRFAIEQLVLSPRLNVEFQTL